MIKVIQWTSGGVARETTRAILSHPDLALIGMYAYSEAKAGCDAGELVGLAPLGINATADIDQLIGLKPDVVSYNPLYPDIDQLCQLLSAGINIVTTCNFMTGWGLDYQANRYGRNARQRLQGAALVGGASMFGTGINPGHINYQACVMSSVCSEIEHLRITEAVPDITPFLGDPNIAAFGYGQPLDTPGLESRQKEESAVFGDALEVMGSLLDIELDEIRCRCEVAPASEDFDTPGGVIARGTVAGVRLRWEGCVSGEPVLENQQLWVCGRFVEGIEDWQGADKHGYIIDIRGDPNVHSVMLPIPRQDISKMTLAERHALGMRITGLPSINAIPHVCAAAPGIRTYKDIPPVVAGGRLFVKT